MNDMTIGTDSVQAQPDSSSLWPRLLHPGRPDGDRGAAALDARTA